MSVLVLVRMRGKTDRLLEASDRLAEAFGMPDGLTAQVTAPTDEGIVIMQLWESEEQRQLANEDPGQPRRAAVERAPARDDLGLGRGVRDRAGQVRGRGRRAACAPPQAGATAEGRPPRPAIPCDPRGRSSMVEQEPSKL